MASQSGSLRFDGKRQLRRGDEISAQSITNENRTVSDVQCDSSFFCCFVCSAKHRRKINWIDSAWSIRRFIQFIVLLSFKRDNNELTWYSIYAGNTLVEIFIICQLRHIDKPIHYTCHILYHRHYIYFIEDYYVVIKIFNHGWPSQKNKSTDY